MTGSTLAPADSSWAAAARGGQSDLAAFAELCEAIAAEPAAGAELVLAAVVEERFWIETDELYRDPIRTRHRSIEAQTEPPARGLILAPYLDR